MIIASLENTVRTERIHPLFKKLFEYVRSHDLRRLPAGRITLQGDDLFINLSDTTLCGEMEQKLEVHRKYIDVHFPLSGEERVGWSDLSSLGERSEKAFDTANDFALYAVPASVCFTINPGDFYVMFPEDAHAPAIGRGKLRKAVAKVRVQI